ncbi:hypothetical protein V8E55_006897 [Tylopilus felleus]
MRIALALFATSFAFVLGSPLVDISPNTQQLLLGSKDSLDQAEQCQPEGSLCDWPAGSRGPCCPPFLCVPLSVVKTPYLVCADVNRH